MSKPACLSGHAYGQLARRGVSEEEAMETIRSWPGNQLNLGVWNAVRISSIIVNGMASSTRPSRCVRSLEEVDEIVVVTVYSYYF